MNKQYDILSAVITIVGVLSKFDYVLYRTECSFDKIQVLWTISKIRFLTFLKVSACYI